MDHSSPLENRVFLFRFLLASEKTHLARKELLKVTSVIFYLKQLGFSNRRHWQGEYRQREKCVSQNLGIFCDA